MALQIFANMSNPQIFTAIILFASSIYFHFPPRFFVPKPLSHDLRYPFSNTSFYIAVVPLNGGDAKYTAESIFGKSRFAKCLLE